MRFATGAGWVAKGGWDAYWATGNAMKHSIVDVCLGIVVALCSGLCGGAEVAWTMVLRRVGCGLTAEAVGC